MIKSELKIEAEAIIQSLTLFELLAPFGTVRLVGSVALDLIVKLDIDIHLLVETADLYAVVDPIYHALLNQPLVSEIRISDYRPRSGLKIGVDVYPGPSGLWSIDLLVTDHAETTGFALSERLARELTTQHRTVIMSIKQALNAQGRLRDGISKRVYLAVLEGGVRSFDEFQRLESEG